MNTGIYLRHRLTVCYLGVAFCCLLLSPFRVGGKAPNSSTFVRAAEQNSLLKTELRWKFGGKAQRGWALYESLIRRTIETDSAPDSGDFAAALSRWQKRVGLTPNGVLNHAVWMKMVSIFQSNRVGKLSLSQTEQLELVPSSYFYDPERPEELRHVDKQAFAAYRQMIAAAATDLSLPAHSSERWLKIISAYRSRAHQAELRKRNPRSGRAGLAVNSPHFSGRALDLYVGGEPVSTKDHNRAIQVKTQVYQWLVKNAGRFGFQPYFYEPWHWEYKS
jgi:hypothetical protein